jgi:hypothetical protein
VIAKDPDDHRGRQLDLTPEGKTLLASAVPIWEHTHRDVETLLTDVDPDLLRSSLRAPERFSHTNHSLRRTCAIFPVACN